MVRRCRGWAGPPPAGSVAPPPQPGQSAGAALDHLTGDDGALDLAGALPDPFYPQFAVEAFGHVFPHVPAAAEDLHGAVGDPPGHLGAVELRHRALRVRDLDIATAVDVAGGLILRPANPTLPTVSHCLD